MLLSMKRFANSNNTRWNIHLVFTRFSHDIKIHRVNLYESIKTIFFFSSLPVLHFFVFSKLSIWETDVVIYAYTIRMITVKHKILANVQLCSLNNKHMFLIHNHILHNKNTQCHERCYYTRRISINWCFVWHVSLPFTTTPDSKVHGANMRPTWVLSAPNGPHCGPMNLAIRGPLFKCSLIRLWFKREHPISCRLFLFE